MPGLDSLDDLGLRRLSAAWALAAWDGHGPQALAAFADLAQRYPEDYRPLLGRGLALRAAGRTADSDRALIAARFLAPKGEQRAAVDAIIGQNLRTSSKVAKAAAGAGGVEDLLK